jgi:hypothetical protein
MLLSLSNSLTKPLELRPSWEPATCAILMKFPAHYGTPRFGVLFTGNRHRANPEHSALHFIKRSLPLLSTLLLLCFPICLIVSDFRSNNIHSLPPPHSCYNPCPSHLPNHPNSNYTWQTVPITKLKNDVRF